MLPTAAAMPIAAAFSLQCSEKAAANGHCSLEENACFFKESNSKRQESTVKVSGQSRQQEQREKAATPLHVATCCCGSMVVGGLEENSICQLHAFKNA